MPTGYTTDLPETFREYALRCARAFGALVDLREEPLDAPIPEAFAPSDHHSKALAKARESLRVAQAWTPAEAEAAAQRAYQGERRRHEKERQRCEALAARYAEMLAQVKAWKPPTPDHQELKTFMREQLEISKSDCTVYPLDPPLSGVKFRAEKIRQAQDDIVYHLAEHREEITRATARTAWIAALRNSL